MDSKKTISDSFRNRMEDFGFTIRKASDPKLPGSLPSPKAGELPSTETSR
jgi:hypothetical protein